MLNYAVVAIGSAVGGMARYGLGLAVGRLAGEAFPWGTLLINVIGSFVIGWFAQATAADAGAPGQTQLRLLVMVGLCGGFTTFSSFSLQTLQLARQGQLGGAIGNVVLSVVLCLASVCAGSLLGQRGSRHEAALPRPVLALVATPAEVGPMMDAAARAAGVLAAPLSVAFLDPRGHGDLPGEEVLPAVLLLPTSPLMAERAAALGAWWQGAAVPMPRLVGGALEGPIGQAGLVVLSHDAASAPLLQAALLGARRPVLLLPARGWRESRTVAVGWKPSAPLLRALDAAWPLVGRARRVVFLSVGAAPGEVPEPLYGRLVREGIAVSADFVPEGRSVAASLLAGAHAAGAGLLVVGAYGSPPLAERLFGGTTREVIANAALPVLLHG